MIMFEIPRNWLSKSPELAVEIEGWTLVDDGRRLRLAAQCRSGRAVGLQHRTRGTYPGRRRGLTRAFMYAETPAVEVTLWSVASKAAYQVNTRFFTHLKAGQPLAEALRQAKLELIEGQDYRHPFFWSPFVVFGDGRIGESKGQREGE